LLRVVGVVGLVQVQVVALVDLELEPAYLLRLAQTIRLPLVPVGPAGQHQLLL